MGIASFRVTNRGKCIFEIAWFGHAGQNGHRGYFCGALGDKWSHTVKPIYLPKAARVVTRQMKSTSEKNRRCSHIVTEDPVSLICYVYLQIKDTKSFRQFVLLQLFLWVELEQ